MRTGTPLIAALALGSLCLTGCDDDKKSKATEDSATADAGINRAMRDKNIDKALQAAAGKGSAAPQVVDGPPQNGVFAPGASEKAHPSSAPPAIKLFDQGKEPRIVLTPVFGAGATVLRVQVGKRTGPQAYPNLVYTLQLAIGADASKPAPAEDEAKEGKKKGAKKGKDEDAEPAPSPAAAKPLAGAQPVALRLTSVMLAGEQPGRLPAGLAAEVMKMVGTRVVGTLDPRGALYGLRLEPSKDVTPAMKGLLEALVEGMGLLVWPVPNEPVGVGASWMITDRASYQGMGVVRYRVAKVTHQVQGEMVLTQDLRQYAASPAERPEGAPQGTQLQQVQSLGNGSWTRKAGRLLPTSGEAKLAAAMQLAMTDQPQRGLPVQIELMVKIPPPAAAKVDDAGDEDKKDKKSK